MKTWNWSLIIQVAVQIITLLFGGVVGYFTRLIFDRRKEKREEVNWQRQLLNQLSGIEEEIKKNRLTLNQINTD